MHVFSLVLLTAAFTGCITDQTLAPPTNPFDRWTALGLHNYTIEQVRVCFCGGSGDTVRITVRADTVASAQKLSDGTLLSPTVASWYRSVDQLFGAITTTSPDSLVVAYDPNAGYPTYLDLYPQLHPVDGGVTYVTFRLTPQ